MSHIAFVSWGNDSIAMVQWLHERGTQDVTCVFSDTGWAVEWWLQRVSKGEQLAKQYGFKTARIPSEGMQRLVQLRKGWPSNQHQFCTNELKIKPAMAWMDATDPDAEAICTIGIRREESRRRQQFPEWVEESDGHGGRSLWAPLVRVLEAERNALVERAGFDVLTHRSMECYPCVNANRSDLRMLSPERVNHIEALETDMGYTSKGKPRTMYRPRRFKGAVGIREVKRWADSARGTYDPTQEQLSLCDSGWCGG